LSTTPNDTAVSVPGGSHRKDVAAPLIGDPNTKPGTHPFTDSNRNSDELR
jgi:hypothetical protein